MKTSFLLPLFCIGAALAAIPLQAVLADDGAPAGQSTPSDGPDASSGNATTGQHDHPRLRKLFTKLDLSDAQKERIKQIRGGVTDRKERREEILNVLTPEQKAKLRELIERRKNGAHPGAGSSSTPGEN